MSKPTTALTAGRPSARTDKARAATLASLADDAGGMNGLPLGAFMGPGALALDNRGRSVAVEPRPA